MDTEPTADATTMNTDQATTLVSAIERLLERIDRDRDESSLSALKLILEQHGDSLKQFMQPENRLHPDISWYNPMGEKEHPRPPLKRPAFFLGSPLEMATLSVDEIDLLNKFDRTVEVNVRGKLWKAAILRNMAGQEILYISVPFRNFDDLRGLPGQLEIYQTLLSEGKRPQSQDLLHEQLQLQAAEIKELRTMISDFRAQPSDSQVTTP